MGRDNYRPTPPLAERTRSIRSIPVDRVPTQPLTPSSSCVEPPPDRCWGDGDHYWSDNKGTIYRDSPVAHNCQTPDRKATCARKANSGQQLGSRRQHCDACGTIQKRTVVAVGVRPPDEPIEPGYMTPEEWEARYLGRTNKDDNFFRE